MTFTNTDITVNDSGDYLGNNNSGGGAPRSLSTQKPQSFEESMHKLREIVVHLERGEISLEQAIKMYSQGIELYKSCSQQLAEAKVVIKNIFDENSDSIQQSPQNKTS